MYPGCPRVDVFVFMLMYFVTAIVCLFRCMMRNCGKWEFVKGLCKECSKSAASVAHLVNKNWAEYKNKAPIAVNMVVITERPDGHFIELKEGEYVHILEYVADQPDLCIVRTAAEKIGYGVDEYNGHGLDRQHVIPHRI